MKIRTVPIQPHFFQAYMDWCKARAREPRPWFFGASTYIWVEAEGHGLVLGVAIQESPGLVTAEEVQADPRAPSRLVHAAVQLAIADFATYCAVTGKLAVAHTSIRGIAKMLAKKGFQQQPVWTLTRAPMHQVTVARREPKPKPKRRRIGPRRKKA